MFEPRILKSQAYFEVQGQKPTTFWKCKDNESFSDVF